ncbi:GDSL-type esterase/lipase family protein [Candidatus Binatia bacterium]|nr:GDSL-type esterase/lipase family protein [Candidatus Binatia bacterium]
MTRWRRRRWAAGAAAAIGVVAILVGGAEAALRLLAPQGQMDMFAPDARLGFRLTPNFRGEISIGSERLPIEVNSLGLRNREIGPRRSGALRLLVLGDSFVFGYGVSADATLAAVLERMLVPPEGCTAVEVVNGGVPRYGTVQEIGLFEATADDVRPDLVLLGVFVGNDAIDNLAVDRSVGAGEAPLGAWIEWVRVRSRLYAWARRQRHAAADRRGELQRQVVGVHGVDPPAELTRGLGITETAIARLAKLAGGRGIPFGVVLIPSAAQVHPERWAALLREYGDAATTYDVREPNRRLAAFAAAHGVPLLDLTPALTAARNEPLYSVLHWTARGHAVAAAAVAEFLSDSDLLAQAGQVARKWEPQDAVAPVCRTEAAI